MVSKSDFTEQEWAAIVDAPQLAGVAVMVAGASGIIGSIKEAAAAAEAVWSGNTHSHELIRLISSKEEMQASQRIAPNPDVPSFKGVQKARAN